MKNRAYKTITTNNFANHEEDNLTFHIYILGVIAKSFLITGVTVATILIFINIFH
jgi:hypothetical protein